MTILDEVRIKAESDARSRGMYLNPDKAHLQNLLEGLKENTDRYGYPSCPCRIASGKLEIDRDIICPCDYRDPDVTEYGSCYCALYVNDDIHYGVKQAEPIPERRPYDKQMKSLGLEEDEGLEKEPIFGEYEKSSHKLFYCKQCGYVVFRDEPPYICPICKAKKEMFGEIVPTTGYFTKNIF